MKKILSIILALAMLLSFASCAVNNDKENYSDNIINNVEEKIDEVVDEFVTVTFTLPKMGDEPPETELTDEEKEAGFISVVINDDGSSTYTMKKSAWEDYLEEFRTTGLDNILNTSENGYESIYSYEINKDLDVATLYVDYDKYNSGADGFVMINVHLVMTLIQYINGATDETVSYTINIADYQTKEIKDTISMPQ